MIKLKKENFENPNFIGAFLKLQKFHVTADGAYKLDRYLRKLEPQQDQYLKTKQSILLRYTEKDETGKPKMEMAPVLDAEGKPETYQVPVESTEVDLFGAPIEKFEEKPKMRAIGYIWTDKDAANSELQTLASEEFVIADFPVMKNDWKSAELTVAEWLALKPFIADAE